MVKALYDVLKVELRIPDDTEDENQLDDDDGDFFVILKVITYK